MADDRSKAGAGDRKRVNIGQEHEVKYWCNNWGVSPEQLEAAVKAVGPMSGDVARHLGKPNVPQS